MLTPGQRCHGDRYDLWGEPRHHDGYGVQSVRCRRCGARCEFVWFAASRATKLMQDGCEIRWADHTVPKPEPFSERRHGRASGSAAESDCG